MQPVEGMSTLKRPAPVSLGLIGFGAIGRGVCDLLQRDPGDDTRIVGILVRDATAHRIRRPELPFVEGGVAELLDLLPSLVVEAAGHTALAMFGASILRSGRDLLIVSVGALADDGLMTRLMEAASIGRSRLRIASGSIAGLDAISAASLIGLDSVHHTVRKPPNALLQPADAAEVERLGVASVLFAGAAREAVLRFPQNANVVAAVSLAGLGFDRTSVSIIADPSVTLNTHEVAVRGVFGELDILMRNQASPENPKTGRIAAASVVRQIRSDSDRLVIGS